MLVEHSASCCYTVLTRVNQLCCPRWHFWLSVWSLSCRCCVKFSTQYCTLLVDFLAFRDQCLASRKNLDQVTHGKTVWNRIFRSTPPPPSLLALMHTALIHRLKYQPLFGKWAHAHPLPGRIIGAAEIEPTLNRNFLKSFASGAVWVIWQHVQYYLHMLHCVHCIIYVIANISQHFSFALWWSSVQTFKQDE